jgi:glycosyltransferase involved in cell wall biosynthesis
MRVAVLGIKNLPAFAGADRVVEHLLEHLSPDHEYTVYLVKDGRPHVRCGPNRRYVYIPALKGKHLRAVSYFFLCCVHYLFKGDYDVAHVHNSDFGIFSPLLKLKRGVRVVGTFHGDPYKRDKWSGPAKSLLRVSEWLFVRSCDTLTSVSAEKRVGRRPIHYIPNGVDQTAADSDSPSPHDAVDLHGGYVMFACGRLDRTKGLHHLLSAYADVPTEKSLLVVGDFSHDAEYSAAIERGAAADSRIVLHRELLDRQKLFSVLRHCSVFVFPSEFEAMSMMLLEAVACEKLVVCSDIPANIAVVGGDYPFLFRSQDPASLRAVLERALDASASGWDPRPLLERVTSTYRWDVIAADYERLYERRAA